MKVLVLASQKGGAGKTTLAAHLAVAATIDGAGPAVLIDTDPQGSLSAWWNSREADAPALASATLAELPAKLASLADAGFKLAVIDTPPAITAGRQQRTHRPSGSDSDFSRLVVVAVSPFGTRTVPPPAAAQSSIAF